MKNMKYKVIQYMSWKGTTYRGGEVIEVSEKEAETFAPGFIERAEKRAIKTKSVVTKKIK